MSRVGDSYIIIYTSITNPHTKPLRTGRDMIGLWNQSEYFQIWSYEMMREGHVMMVVLGLDLGRRDGRTTISWLNWSNMNRKYGQKFEIYKVQTKISLKDEFDVFTYIRSRIFYCCIYVHENVYTEYRKGRTFY